MAMVTGQLRAMMRRVTAGFLTDDVEIQRESIVNQYGTVQRSWLTVATVGGRVMHVTEAEATAVSGGVEQGRANYKLAIPFDADLRDGDRVRVAGVVYEVRQMFARDTDVISRFAHVVRLGE